MNTHSEDYVLDRMLTAYLINDRILKEIMIDPWSHPTATPEDIKSEMLVLYDEMIDRIPESHSFAILSLVYGGM